MVVGGRVVVVVIFGDYRVSPNFLLCWGWVVVEVGLGCDNNIWNVPSKSTTKMGVTMDVALNSSNRCCNGCYDKLGGKTIYTGQED